MPVLAPVDWLMLALDLFFMMAVALAVRPHVQTAGDYLEAGRSLPGWISAVAFAAIGLGGLAPMAGGFYGSRHGLQGFRRAELLYRLGDVAAARERYYMAIELDEDYVERGPIWVASWPRPAGPTCAGGLRSAPWPFIPTIRTPIITWPASWTSWPPCRSQHALAGVFGAGV